ncbi:MAG: hypothetical protein ABH823_01870 [bacterium]
MLRKIIIVSLALGFAVAAQAYMLNSSQVIGAQRMVLQLGYANRNFGDQTTANRAGAEVKLAYGLNDPWDALFYINNGQYPDVAGQTYQSFGLDFEYGVIRGRPVDISLVLGGQVLKNLNGGAVVLEYTNWRLAALLGRSIKREDGVAIITPYTGAKLEFINPSTGAGSKDFEVLLGLKYGLNGALSVMLEGSYHWMFTNTTFGGSEIGFGVAWAI